MLPDDRLIQILQYIDQVFRQQIDHADKKAATVIACVAILFTLNKDLIGIARDDFLMRLFSRDGLIVVWLIGALGLSMSFAFLTITPRLNANRMTILFWRSWLDPATRPDREMQMRDPAFVKSEFLSDIEIVSAIVERKMYWLKLASMMLYIGLLAFVVLVVRKTFFA